MRRTTICRSRATGAAAAFAVALWTGTLAAQQPQAPPANPQQPAAAPAPAQRAGPPPATHIVAEGETLWSLAQQFFGDPMLWPEIYRLNTDVVEDPHWIFPGEELRMQPAEASAPGNLAITPTPDSARGAQPTQALPPTIFSEQVPAQRQAAAVRVAAQRAYRAVREGEYYSSGFLAEASSLTTGVIVGPIERSAISRLSTRGSANLFGTVAIRPPGNEGLRPDDLLLAFSAGRPVRGYGDVILPSGLVRVETDTPAGENAEGVVIALYAPLIGGQRYVKVEPFPSQASARPSPVDSGIVGQVVTTRAGREIVSLQSVLYIDRGAEDGVRLGDVFSIVSLPDPATGAAAREQAQVVVVYTRPRTATCIVVDVSQPDIHPGATARQVGRVPS